MLEGVRWEVNENVQTHSQKVYLVFVCVCVCVCQSGWWHELKVRVPLSLKMNDFWKVFDKGLFSTSHSFRSQHKPKRSKTYNTRIHPDDRDFKRAIIYGFEVVYMLLSSSDSLLNGSAGFEQFFVRDTTSHRPWIFSIYICLLIVKWVVYLFFLLFVVCLV